uniref:EGF-like domain-containing protein n=1 Tax=Angiostrongylus cantonensis TaxID=6313 RepID=A0A0K0D149_ANGCA
MLTSNGCVCNKGHAGDNCQYMTNCHHDGDCLNGGKCLPEPNSIVVASCYCSYGFFGNSCELFFKREPDNCFAYEMVDEQRFNMYGMFSSSCYNREKLADDDFVYYRKVKSDVEIILDYATTSWISIGWRPEVLDRSCRLFPDLEGVRSKRSTHVEVPSVAQPQSARLRRNQSPTTSRRHSGEIALDRDRPPTRIAQEGPRPTMPHDNGLSESALHAPLHAMDCIDILIGAVRDGRTRVQDSYSRDRSTPLEDFWYEGEMSLVGAYGRELDGRTIVMFRRPMQEIEPTDHPLGPGRLFVVSAKGQQQGAYSHGAPSALEVAHTIELFYMDDILKYHGSMFLCF